ncbi:sigma-70 family RNA polymerase sigma factor [Thalassoglobus polymorphus]|uniref:ECF RNA polymerase sigma-E factor n=1 Tax=Thalassoglobus polymorphus TaxID=2527994 RepID=A0A517QMZ1_9PLAN|nr:sigma-70 family RNA polymerase sigma factor [Thalassoglobus polymorphus]QDT33006.1 ECF RNA polymerase sigma-E factor [Thalassoglobus polymorphus]
MPSESPNEELLELVAKAQAGDESALGELLDTYRDQLRTLAERELDYQMTARVDASDVVQQTFLSACKKVNDFQGKSEQEFVAWIYQIHRHNIQDLLRRHLGAEKRNLREERSSDFKEIPSNREQSSPSQQVIKLEQSQSLADLIHQLPTDQKAAVQMRHLEGKTLEEIAAKLGRTSQAVASLLKRGLENLRKLSTPE